MNLSKLKEPFPIDSIHWRVGATTGDKSKGIALAYIDARDVMDRLDDVVGPGFWQNRYPSTGVCEIGILVGDKWVWKSDGAGETDYEGTKGQFSDAFKRAAVKWGIGRYLYALPNEWVKIKPAGKSFKLDSTPTLPKWALPGYSKPMDKVEKDKAVNGIVEAIQGCDDEGLKEIVSELNTDETMYVWREFNSAQRGTIKTMLKT